MCSAPDKAIDVIRSAHIARIDKEGHVIRRIIDEHDGVVEEIGAIVRSGSSGIPRLPRAVAFALGIPGSPVCGDDSLAGEGAASGNQGEEGY